jgi:hypothetical protein
MYRIRLIFWVLVLLIGARTDTFAQADVIKNVRTAMKAGSSKELVKYMNNTVELTFDGEKSSYSKTQAEFVLKDFFKRNPPRDFQYIHQGASKEKGLKYVIGKYTCDSGSYRVYMLFKQFKGVYMVDLIDFSKE